MNHNYHKSQINRQIFKADQLVDVLVRIQKNEVINWYVINGFQYFDAGDFQGLKIFESGNGRFRIVGFQNIFGRIFQIIQSIGIQAFRNYFLN